MKILQTIYEWNNKDLNHKCGLYHVEMPSGDKHYLLRNGDSVGVITHLVGRPAFECVCPIRDDVKQKFLKRLGGK